MHSRRELAAQIFDPHYEPNIQEVHELVADSSSDRVKKNRQCKVAIGNHCSSRRKAWMVSTYGTNKARFPIDVEAFNHDGAAEFVAVSAQ